MEVNFKNMVKKLTQWIAIVTLIVLAVLPAQASTVSADAKEGPIKIGILQFVEHKALDAVREGFMKELEASKYADRIEWDVQNASGDQNNLKSINTVIARDNDILFAIATPAAISLANVEEEKPIFIAAVTDPVEAKLAESMEKPGRNVTGTSDMQPIDEQVDLLIRNFPEAKTVGLIYNSGEVNSVLQANEAVKLLEEKGLKTEVATVTQTNDIDQAMRSLVRNVDAMFMVTDNLIDSAITLVGDIAKEHKIPTIGSSDSVVLENGLATLSNSYEDYGRQTAQMVIDMLDNDLNPAEMPIQLGKDFKVVVNEEFAKAIGLDPKSIK